MMKKLLGTAILALLLQLCPAFSSGDNTVYAQPKTTFTLTELRQEMSVISHAPVAVAYLGYRAPNDLTPLKDWLQKNCSFLLQCYPFIKDISNDNVFGKGGDLYCIVPRDKTTSMSINKLKWQRDQEENLSAEYEEILYRNEYAEPLLLFINFSIYGKADTEVIAVANNGRNLRWLPERMYSDNYIYRPENEAGEQMLYDLNHAAITRDQADGPTKPYQ